MTNDEAAAKAAGVVTSGVGAVSSWILADEWTLAILGVPVSVVVAAFAGAVLALSFLPVETAPRWPWWVRVVVATLGGSILEPLAAHAFGIPDKAGLGLAALLAAALQVLAVQQAREVLVGWARRRWGGGA